MLGNGVPLTPLLKPLKYWWVKWEMFLFIGIQIKVYHIGRDKGFFPGEEPRDYHMKFYLRMLPFFLQTKFVVTTAVRTFNKMKVSCLGPIRKIWWTSFLVAESFKEKWQVFLEIYLNNYIHRLYKCYIGHCQYTLSLEKNQRKYCNRKGKLDWKLLAL